MDFVFLLGASQAAFLSFLIFNKKGKSHGDYVLASWLFFMGLHLLMYYFHSSELIFEYPHLLGAGEFFPMLQGPFMFIYVMVMINETGKLKRIYLLHTLPFLIIVSYFMFDFYSLGAEAKLNHYNELVESPNTGLIIASYLNSYLGPIYVILSLVKLRKHVKNISNRFSYTDEIDLKWLRYVLIGMGVVWIVVIASSIMDLVGPTGELGNQMTYTAVVFAIFFLGYFGIKQHAIYVQSPAIPVTQPSKSQPSSEESETDRYKNSGLKKAAAEQYLRTLLEHMEKDRPYLNGKLSLKDVAQHLEISINHLSQVINEQLHKSFFDFVNTYRVEEVKRLLDESKHEQLTLLAVAYDSGFNSKSSFNGTFKKITGATPSQYLKQKSEQVLSS